LAPCGEYLFDYRNASLLPWLLDNFVLSNTTLLAAGGVISGLFLDDYWCSPPPPEFNNSRPHNETYCSNPAPGPSETLLGCVADLGLQPADIYDLTIGWQKALESMQSAVLSAGGYTWSLMPGQKDANAQPVIVNSTNCIKWLTRATSSAGCQALQQAPLLAGLSYNGTLESFPWLQQQLAAFLLMRGPYAWLGWGDWGLEWYSPH
jgi:hypothetical protein